MEDDGAEVRSGGASRPWTAAAAMEPVPPLAPPPARPGAGRAVEPAPRTAAGSATRRAVLLLVATACIVAVILLIVVRV